MTEAQGVLSLQYYLTSNLGMRAGSCRCIGGHGPSFDRKRPLHFGSEPQAHVCVLCSSLLRSSAGPMFTAAYPLTKGTVQPGGVRQCDDASSQHLSWCRRPFHANYLRTQVQRVAILGSAVVGTCILCWLPYLGSAGDALRVLRRITPVQRGLFEDYVANFWCTTNPLVHWKQQFSQQTLVRLCMGAVPWPVCFAKTPTLWLSRLICRKHGDTDAGVTCFAFLPSMVQQIRNPSKQVCFMSPET